MKNSNDDIVDISKELGECPETVEIPILHFIEQFGVCPKKLSREFISGRLVAQRPVGADPKDLNCISIRGDEFVRWMMTKGDQNGLKKVIADHFHAQAVKH